MNPPTVDWRSVREAAPDPGAARRARGARAGRLRNVLVHAYLDVDHDVVVAAAPLAVEQYGEYVRQVAAFVSERCT